MTITVSHRFAQQRCRPARLVALGIGAILAISGVLVGTVPTTATAHVASTVVSGPLMAAGGDHSLVIDDGVVYGTGFNGRGLIGRGRLTGAGSGPRSTLLRLTGLPDDVHATAVAGGSAHSLVLGDDNLVYGTGSNNRGQLTAPIGESFALRALSGLPDEGAQPIAIAAGNTHSLVMGSNGVVYGTGGNSFGELTAPLADRTTLTRLSGLPEGVQAVAMDAGGDHSLVVASDGKAYGTGRNSFGQLTGTATRTTLAPLELPAGVKATAVAAGANHSLVVGSNGTVYGTGLNDFGQLTGTDPNEHRNTLTPLAGLPNGVRAAAVAAGASHSLVLGDNGVVYGTGRNAVGQLTGTNPADRRILTPLTGLPAGVRAAAIDAGLDHSLVLGSDAMVYGAGDNSDGELTGAGDRFTLTPLTGTQVAAGNAHSLVLGRDGIVYGSGRNTFGQLTGASSADRRSLTPLIGLPPGVQATAIAAGPNHSLVLDSNGVVYGTGINGSGQLTGSGDRSTLTPLAGLPSTVHAIAIAASSENSLVVGSDKKVYGAGRNLSGQLTGSDTGNRAILTPLAGQQPSINPPGDRRW
ncbi:RCC1 domain-containing protein [Kribbella catacumbae]|uniref:RCC1 domain-containing protein n=1 Tax=Kribbella catacumbae TaxID=460086 RepID=UPI0003A14926|nr:hypothetical protein [Kribbella catacumbae]